MQLFRTVCIIFLILVTLPTQSAAQINQSGPVTLLFSCTFNNGANTVQVDMSDDDIVYFYNHEDSDLDLIIIDNTQTVSYRPFLWDSHDITESVTFYNGDTAYEVFGTLRRSGWSADSSFVGGQEALGGIVVTSPSGERTELPCDPNSLQPQNPVVGIGRLASLDSPGYDMFDRCVQGIVALSACVGSMSSLCIANDSDVGNSEMKCLHNEYVRWEEMLATAFAETCMTTADRGYDLDALELAQTSWQTSRNIDCEIGSWTIFNYFDGDKGRLSCLSHYAAQRIYFLNRYTSGVLFDG